MLRNRILAYFKPAIEREKRHRLAFFAGIVSFTLLGMMAASAITPADMHAPSIEFQDIVEHLALANIVSIDTGSGNDFFHEERIQPSDSVASLLKRLGVSDPEVFEFILKNQKTQAVSRQMRPGKTIAAQTGALGEFKALYFPLNGKDNVLAVRKNGASFEADEQTLTSGSYITLKAGEIRNSLFGATDAAGVPDSIALQIAEIFGGVIDFHRDLRKGDRFFIAYETLARAGGGSSVRAGRVLAAEFINNQKIYTAFLFKTADGKEGYYSADGASLRRAFLRSPLEFSRITSGFSASRFHPVLKIWRSHKGTDYAAPTGTHVLSVSDGRIEFAGRQNGYGNLIIVKHNGAFSTAYAHLSGFAPGIRKGVSVSQGEVIGYVGQTGLATGPHLHYEFRVNSVQVNPLTIALPEAIPLEATEIERFMALSTPQKNQIALAKEIQPAPHTLE
ncbi:MAG: M23 family metallopeptidase [Candidatus Accumulibacter sp.]|jgi:murein DD-endopeptidase MepM/ murein hydrolase activator NlpD|nr:M23 family metallopeptidase [Accumulibacter sp.]